MPQYACAPRPLPLWHRQQLRWHGGELSWNGGKLSWTGRKLSWYAWWRSAQVGMPLLPSSPSSGTCLLIMHHHSCWQPTQYPYESKSNLWLVIAGNSAYGLKNVPCLINMPHKYAVPYKCAA